MSQVRLKECQNELESSMFVDILLQKFYRIPALSKIKFGISLLPLIHQVMKADIVKYQMTCTGLEKLNRET